MPLARSLLLGLLLSWAPLTARAQSRPEELDRNAAAVASGRRGLEAFRNGEWTSAYALFHEAETLAHSPVFLLYMARARARHGAFAEALDLYALVNREPLDERAPDSWRSAVEQAQRESAELRARLARQEARDSAPPLAASTTANATASTSGSDHAAALAAGAVGVAGLAMGVVAGLVAWTTLNDLKERCGPSGCDPADKSKLERARTWARLSDLGFVVGGTGIATSAVFLWVVPATPNASMHAGVSARLRF